MHGLFKVSSLALAGVLVYSFYLAYSMYQHKNIDQITEIVSTTHNFISYETAHFILDSNLESYLQEQNIQEQMQTQYTMKIS